MLTQLIRRTMLLAFLLSIVYAGYLFIHTQQLKKNVLILSSIERTKLSVIQEYQAFRGVTLVDQSNPNDETKIAELLNILKTDPAIVMPETNRADVKELYKKYSDLLKKKQELLKEHEQTSKIPKEKLNKTVEEYTQLLKDFQEVEKKLQ